MDVRRTQGEKAGAKTPVEDGLNTVFKGHSRKLPQYRREVVPEHRQE